MINDIKYSSKDISDKMVTRLTKYLRILNEIRKEKDNVNSVELANKMNTTSSQVRKDLSTFGEFGVRSKGYNIEKLIKIIEHILVIDEESKLVIIGYGNMGSMLAANADVLGKGFKIVGVFDKDPKKIGTKIPNLNIEVLNIKKLEQFLKEEKIEKAILAVNKEVAQKIADTLMKFGIKAILNLTSYKIVKPDYVASVEVDFSLKLQELNFWRKYNKLKYENK
ncbi:redox-sensing transcriptional repressor Rex [Oceanivirga salmonicida]|uniref:redox-sensing transcriptional repressor Rex n=1 Tax=Oceanivirga salmonicida TaxID=1769291 RepID=UPI00082CB3EB|nr:redox-sensing transcriptional repressor Rex [Oceanivirga salmonicida]